MTREFFWRLLKRFDRAGKRGGNARVETLPQPSFVKIEWCWRRGMSMEAVTGVLLNATESDGIEGNRGCANFAEDKGSGGMAGEPVWESFPWNTPAPPGSGWLTQNLYPANSQTFFNNLHFIYNSFTSEFNNRHHGRRVTSILKFERIMVSHEYPQCFAQRSILQHHRVSLGHDAPAVEGARHVRRLQWQLVRVDKVDPAIRLHEVDERLVSRDFASEFCKRNCDY